MLETELDLCMPPTTGPGSSGRFANAGVATTPSRRMPKEDADQINDDSLQTDPRTNKRFKVAKWAVSKAASASLVGKSQSAVANPTTSSMVIAVTLTRAHDATTSSSIMSSTSITASSSDLASLIYSTYILDQLKSNSNFELNLHKHFFRKFYYP